MSCSLPRLAVPQTDAPDAPVLQFLRSGALEKSYTVASHPVPQPGGGLGPYVYSSKKRKAHAFGPLTDAAAKLGQVRVIQYQAHSAALT